MKRTRFRKIFPNFSVLGLLLEICEAYYLHYLIYITFTPSEEKQLRRFCFCGYVLPLCIIIIWVRNFTGCFRMLVTF